MQEAIYLDKVFFSYQNTPVLSDASTSINKGEFISIIGPNGGGKTTFLKLLMGFLPPDKGVIKIFGAHPKKVRKKIAYVPQILHYDRFFPISLLEVVLSGRLSHIKWYQSYRPEDREAAIKAIASVKLSHLQDKPFGSLSGGQAQRALIARALVSEPEILLLDEPTACLDVTAESKIFELLTELQNKITILMVTHDLDAIIAHVHKVLCIHGDITTLSSKEVCKHFAYGLYHKPIMNSDPLHD